MPQRTAENWNLGGVSSLINPANASIDRSRRCRNFVPLPTGDLKLRYGYTQPTMSAVDASAAIHSAAYYEQYGGTQYVIFGQGTALKRYAVSGGTVTTIGTLSSGNPWGHFRARNALFVGNGVDFKSYDGTTLRDVGIRAANSTESGGVTVAASTATAGSFSTTTLTGYQLYMSYYNPTTGEVGNRAAVGARVTVPAAGYSLLVTGLPSLAAVNSEWLKILGRTPDGGEVPYWFADASGSLLTVGNTAATATFTSTNVSYTSELPTRNTVPVTGLNKFCKVGGRIFAAKDGDINLYYSEAEEDKVSGDFVGRPEAAWPANNVEAFPTGEVPTALHGYGFEGWFFTRNHLLIWDENLRLQIADPWRGPWVGGCAGQRAFVETPYGPYWVSADKQLLKWGGSGPVVASAEYEDTLLAQIADAQVPNIEIQYFKDPAINVDYLKILGKDGSGNPVCIIHDFNLRDETSPDGQGYDEVFTGMSPSTLIGSGYTPRTPMRDTNKKERLWCGSSQGRLFQLEDGTSDNGATYTGDAIYGPLNLGSREPLVNEMQWIGDAQVVFTFTTELDDTLAQYLATQTEIVKAEERRCGAAVGRAGGYFYGRFQLTSHPADGNFDSGDPPFCPVNPYGAIFGVKMKLGLERVEAR
jgi:hypothetical protein